MQRTTFEPPDPVKGLRFLPKASLRDKTGAMPKASLRDKTGAMPKASLWDKPLYCQRHPFGTLLCTYLNYSLTFQKSISINAFIKQLALISFTPTFKLLSETNFPGPISLG
jgi:hypothetical protein